MGSITNLITKATTSLTLNDGLNTFFKVIFANYKDQYLPFFNFIYTLIYSIFKWVLTAIDFCFAMVRQLCGLNTDFSSLDNIVQNDIVFKFIFDDTVQKILGGLFMFAIVVILVLGIIAIIKSEYMAIADKNSTGEIKNSKGKIWISIGQSCLLLVLVPIITFGCIILSNAVLQTLYNATAGYSNQSIGSQIFVASSYQANAYRSYANNNKKIPITYNFSQINDYTAVTDWDTSGRITDVAKALEEYKNASEWTQGYTTFEMFYLSTFFGMDDIDYMQLNGGEENAYNMAYDTGIRSYKYEYLVNADLLDFMMQSGLKIAILTAEEAYNNCLKAGINPLITKTEEDGVTRYNFSVNYNDGQAAIKYSHISGATDESNGAVFIVCVEDSYQEGEVTKYYYKPLIPSEIRGFSTNYLADKSNYIVAKGQFDEGEYPTAIRKVDGVVSYYREKLNVPTIGSFFPHISYEVPEGVTSTAAATNVIKSAIQMVTGIDVSDLIPYVYFDIDLMHLFTKSERTVCSLTNGAYYVDYAFTGEGANLSNLYYKLNINLVILVLAAVLIIKKLVKAFFGVIRRSVDIMFLYLVYPAAVSTIPLYGKSSFGNWVKQMANKVLSMYGLVVGLNLALMLIPLSNQINLVTPEMMGLSSGLFGGFTAGFFNMLIQLLFLLVGINFIFEVPAIVNKFVSGEKGDLVKEGGEVLEETTKVYKKAYNIYTGKFAIDAVHSVVGFRDKNGEYHAGFLPGTAIVSEIDRRKEAKADMKRADELEKKGKQQFEDKKAGLLKEAELKQNREAQSNDAAPSGEAGGSGGSASTGGAAPSAGGDAGEENSSKK